MSLGGAECPCKFNLRPKHVQYTIALEIANSVSNQGCSFDELVTKIKEVFDSKGIPGMIELLLRVIDEALGASALAGNQAKNAHLVTCCEQCRFESKGLRPRTLRSSAGRIQFQCRHFRCVACRTTQVPLLRFLKLEKHQRKSAELEQVVTEVISEQSYRRSSAHLKIIGAIDVPKSTLHGWVKQTDCDQVAMHRERVVHLFPDGTGFKRRPDKAAGTSNRGEVKVLLGVDDEGITIPMGVWSGQSWAEIGESIFPKKEASCEDEQLYLADNLILDGEPGMMEGLEHLAGVTQRCHWHLPRDLGHCMWQDNASLRERKIEAKKLRQMIGIELPKGSVDEISDHDKADLIARLDKAEKELADLTEELDKKGYHTAANYVSNATRHLFTYLGTWMELGIRCPRTNSLIERVMREVGRRLKKIAFGWSEQGAAKMARILLARWLNQAEWAAYWDKRKQSVGDAIILFKGVQVVG